jgi:hypothetical protein
VLVEKATVVNGNKLNAECATGHGFANHRNANVICKATTAKRDPKFGTEKGRKDARR